jgi:hypothetical protein
VFSCAVCMFTVCVLQSHGTQGRLLSWEPDRAVTDKKAVLASHPELQARFLRESALRKETFLADVDGCRTTTLPLLFSLYRNLISSSCARGAVFPQPPPGLHRRHDQERDHALRTGRPSDDGWWSGQIQAARRRPDLCSKSAALTSAGCSSPSCLAMR